MATNTDTEHETTVEDEANETVGDVEDTSPAHQPEKVTSPVPGSDKLTEGTANTTSINAPPPPPPATSEEARKESDSFDRAFVPTPIVPPPWEEWSDAFINEETWNNEIYNGETFEDIFDTTELLQLKSFHWMRPTEFLTGTPAVVKLHSSVIDLICPNAHLCEKYEIIRYILSEISELYEYSLQNKFVECEGEGDAYVPNYAEDDRKWTPWSHIYSCCKAGVRGEKPVYNPKGLYYVRLYFMGAWRRILVDDRIPVLPSGHSGLPLTQLNELWPMLLTKALLKIAIITWKDMDIKRFSSISALTGWVFEWVENIDGVNEEELWSDLQNTLPKYLDPKKIPSCYTLLTPSAKKKRFGLKEESDSFWWMPQLGPYSHELDDVVLTDQDYEPLVLVDDNVLTEDFKIPVDVKWQRKTLHEIHSDHLIANILHRRSVKNPKSEVFREQTNSFSDKTEAQNATPSVMVDTSPSMAGKTKSKKAKKGAIPLGSTEEVGSEKKLGGKKEKNKKQKDKDPEKKEKDPEKKEKEPDKKNKDKDAEKKDRGKSLKAPTTVESLNVNDEEGNDKPEKAELKLKGAKNWARIKDVLLGDAELDNRKTKSVRRSLTAKFEENEEVEEEEEDGEEEAHTLTFELKSKLSAAILPSTQEILYGVEKFAGIDYRNMVKNWENICGKDSPIALVVVLKQFPSPEGSYAKTITTPPPQIPAFLQHPVQLVEVRDTCLQKNTDRPTTPLWKRFRWKAWAMKKGLIPHEEDSSKQIIRAVKVKTPFTFKNDWLEYPEDELTEFKEQEEFLGEDDEDFMMTTFFGLDKIAKEETDVGAGDTNRSQPTSPETAKDFVRMSEVPGSGFPRKTSIFSERKGADSKKLNMLPEKSETDRSRLGHEERIEENDSNTLILHNSEIVHGESEEEYDDDFRATLAQQMETVYPTSACGTVWLDCDDIARSLRKFCKFYTSQSIFGSCYILRREPNVLHPVLDPIFQDIHSDLPKYPKMLNGYKQSKDCLNCSIEFEGRKTYHITNYHLDNREGLESAFYLFSDCWTEQELIITIFMLQEELLKQFNEATGRKSEEMPVPPPTPAKGFGLGRPSKLETTSTIPPLALSLIIEPWDWRKDCCLCEPLIRTTVTDQYIAHVRLPAGRNTFRIWVMLNQSGSQKKDTILELNQINCIPFSIRFVSQTPIYIGSRSEVQNYMTNPPTLFLKQAERLANHIWGLFACFGKKVQNYGQNLKDLRRSYCPAYTSPNKINQFVRGAHDAFEELFLSLIMQFNNGVLDRLMLLAVRVLFLNPMLGRNFVSNKAHRQKEGAVNMTLFVRSLPKKARSMLPNATITIQKYYRGWRVRRLFQMRRRSHPMFRKIEYKVRKMAFILAKETDSIFSYPEDTSEDSDIRNFSKVDLSQQIDPDRVPPTMLPKPPHWSLDLLRYLTDRHPMLLTIYPHAHCAAHHIKIEEFEGELPQKMKDFSWYPFCREVLKVVPDTKSCFCEIDLQVYPTTGIYLKIINNDNGKFLSQTNDRLFIGRLTENKRGYTVLCYRWTFPNLRTDYNDRLSSNIWKIRLITPVLQDGPVFVRRQDDLNTESMDELDVRNSKSSFTPPNTMQMFLEDTLNFDVFEVPRKLCLRRFTGHYIPNKDFSLCQYVFETEEKRVSLSLRFRASLETAQIRIMIWDCTGKDFVYDETCIGGLITPVIELRPLKKRASKGDDAEEEEANEEEHKSSSDLLNLSELDKKSKGSSKTSTKSQGEQSRKSELSNEEKKEENKAKVPKTFRYIISIHTDEKSWPLLDHELLYLFYKERKFFKEIKRTHCKEYVKQQMEKAEQERIRQEQLAAEEAEEEEMLGEADEGLLKTSLEPTTGVPSSAVPTAHAATTTATLPTAEQAHVEKKKHEREEMKLAKKRQTKKDKEISDGMKDKSNPHISGMDNLPDGTAYPFTPPPTTVSRTSLSTQTNEEKVNDKIDKDLKVKRRTNGNLVMKYGGKQSQRIRHLEQPNWMLEIVTDDTVVRTNEQNNNNDKYKVKSNWQLLRKRLLQLKEPWQGEGNVEDLFHDLGQRLEYFLENLIDINVEHDERKFAIIDPISNVFSCLRLQNYELKGMSNSELVELLEQVWSVDPKDNEKATEKLLKIKKSKRCNEEPLEIPISKLDYLPKNLKKLIDKSRRLAEEREAERLLKLLMSTAVDEYEEDEAEEEEEDEDEEEEEEDSYALSTSHLSRKTQEKVAVDLVVPPSTPAKEIAESIAPTVAHYDAKSEKPGAKKGKSKGKKSVYLGISDFKKKGKAGDNKESTGNKNKGVLPTSSKSFEAGTSESGEKDETLEEECESDIYKLKNCEAVGKIFTKYMKYFQDPNPIRQVLNQALENNRMEEEGSKKLVLTRSGISKYCGGDDTSQMPPPAESQTGESPSKVTVVSDKLLQWTKDYTCLPNAEETDEKIQDVGDFSQFFIRQVVEENPDYYVLKDETVPVTDSKDEEEEAEEVPLAQPVLDEVYELKVRKTLQKLFSSPGKNKQKK